MVKTGLLCLAFLFIVGGCCPLERKAVQSEKVEAFVSYTAAGKPQGPYLWDFGQVQKDIVLEHEFTFTNNSGKVINITGHNTSCGCTVSEVAKTNLAPGESTGIKVQFNSKGYKGKVQQFVYVNTDDPQNPVFKFTIEAFVLE